MAKKIIFTLIFSLFLEFNLPQIIHAADLKIDCTSAPGACSKTGLDPFFSNSLDGFWYPGRVVTKTMNLKNSSSDTQQMAIQSTRTSLSSILEDALNVSITPVSGGPVIWSGSLNNFNSLSSINLGIFDPGADLDYYFSLSMDPSANNDYKNLQTGFDLTFGFWGEAIGGFREDGGGTTLGVGVSTSTCGDSEPGSAPILISAIGANNQVMLAWIKAADPVTYYLVAYGNSPEAMLYGNPNVGGSETTSYTVSNLPGETTYYFKVRAGNGCMPGDFSDELAATATGGTISSPASGFTIGVLGTQIGITPTPAEIISPTPTTVSSSEVKGTSRTTPSTTLVLGVIFGGLVASVYFWLKFWKPH